MIAPSGPAQKGKREYTATGQINENAAPQKANPPHKEECQTTADLSARRKAGKPLCDLAGRPALEPWYAKAKREPRCLLRLDAFSGVPAGSGLS